MLRADYTPNIQRLVKCDSGDVHPLETAGILWNHDGLFSTLLNCLVCLDFYMEYGMFQVFKVPNPVSTGL